MSTEQKLREALGKAAAAIHSEFCGSVLHHAICQEVSAALALPTPEPSPLSNSETASIINLLSANDYDTSIVLRVAVALQAASLPSPDVLKAADALACFCWGLNADPVGA